MKLSKFSWGLGFVLIVGIIAISLVTFLPAGEKTKTDNPWENVPLRVPHTDYSQIVRALLKALRQSPAAA